MEGALCLLELHLRRWPAFGEGAKVVAWHALNGLWEPSIVRHVRADRRLVCTSALNPEGLELEPAHVLRLLLLMLLPLRLLLRLRRRSLLPRL